MKCIRYYSPKNCIERVSDVEAEKAVASGTAFYVSRSEWKLKVRGPAKR